MIIIVIIIFLNTSTKPQAGKLGKKFVIITIKVHVLGS